MIQPHAWRIYIYIYSTMQFLCGMDWKRMQNMYVSFVRIIFRSTKNGREKRKNEKKFRNYRWSADRRGKLFRPIQITSSAHKSSSFSPINSRGAPATVPATLARIHPRRDEKRRGNRLRVKARDFSISYSTVPYRSFLYRNRDVPWTCPRINQRPWKLPIIPSRFFSLHPSLFILLRYNESIYRFNFQMAKPTKKDGKSMDDLPQNYSRLLEFSICGLDWI